ncbi:MAG: APC family permease [Candidatus Acidiferrales bacterium]
MKDHMDERQESLDGTTDLLGAGPEKKFGSPKQTPGLVQRLGLFDATMIVMGGIVGTGIFVVPELVAMQVHTPLQILGVWVLGGLVAICGGLVYAELSARYPEVGGQYAYLREAYHPIVAFLFGWGLLLVMQTGAVASVAMIFARYFIDQSHVHLTEGFVAGLAIAIFTVVNCLGVRIGGTVQNAFMVSKIVVIAALIGCGVILGRSNSIGWTHASGPHTSGNILTAIGAAMVPVLFTYSGWQAATFVSSEVRNPRRNMPLATVLGVSSVIIMYCLVTFVDLLVLGPERLAHTDAPASAVMRIVLGGRGATFIAVGIMIAALGYIAQAALTAPRVYYAMAQDKLFFKSLAWLPDRTHAPVLAILLQGICAIAIALSGRYDQVLTYVMSIEFIFFCLTGASIFIFRRRTAASIRKGIPGAVDETQYEMPGHPVTTLIFILVCGGVSVNMFRIYPINSFLGLGILLAGVPVYLYWERRNRKESKEAAANVSASSQN